MFVIAGVTGNTGGAAAAALLEAGARVRGIVRDRAAAAGRVPDAIDLAEADLTDADALTRAFEGARGAYVLAPPFLGDADPIGRYRDVGRAVARAARATGLERLVVLSSEGAHLESGTGIIEALHHLERTLAGSAPTLTFLRATYFMDNWREVLPVAVAEGVLPSMLARLDAPMRMVATRDIGRMAAALLLDPAPPAIVELAGPREYSPAEVADRIGAALGRAIAAIAPPRETWVSTLVAAGVGEAYARLLAQMYDAITSGHVRFSGEGASRRGDTTLDDVLAGWVAEAAAAA